MITPLINVLRIQLRIFLHQTILGYKQIWFSFTLIFILLLQKIKFNFQNFFCVLIQVIKMAQFYQYTKARRQFGKPISFADTNPIGTAFYPSQKDNIKNQDYVLRNPNFIELDNITQLSLHQVNTIRVSTGDKGMLHREGGWPQSIDPTQQQQYARFMKKIDKDQNFATQVKQLCEVAQKCMLRNNQIDMFEQYFLNEESDHVVQNISTKTLMLFKDPADVCKRSVSELSWHVDGPNKLAVSYAIPRFQQTPDKMRTCSYVWDLQNPNTPEISLNSPSPLTNLSYNHKLTDIIGAGCANGIVGMWDSRAGADPVAMTHVQRSHSDPVTHFQWLMTKTGYQCVSVSTDGFAYFWDTRKLKEDRTQSLQIKDFNADGKQVTVGATALENSPQAATKYVIGTQQGTIIVANKKPKRPIQINSRLGLDNRHLGPIYSISRNLQFPKVFMTVGDWSAKLWMDDLKTPLVKTRYHSSYLSDGCFSPTRAGAFFLTRKDGWLDVWDYYYRQNEIAFSHKVSDAPLTSIKISYTGSGNQILGGKFAAIGDQDGTVTILQLCQSLYTLQKNQKDIMADIFTREMTKQKNLEALRRLQQLEKKRAPKDMTSIQKKFQQKRVQQISKVQSRFSALLSDPGNKIQNKSQQNKINENEGNQQNGDNES